MGRRGRAACLALAGRRARGQGVRGRPRRARLLRAARHPRPRLRPRSRRRLHVGERRQGDAAGRLPAHDRSAHAERRRARAAAADDRALEQPRRDERLRAARQPAAAGARRAGRDARASRSRAPGRRLRSPRPTRRASSPASTATSRAARVPTRAACCPRSWCASAGASRATPRAAGFTSVLQGRLAAHAERAISCTRWPASSAATSASRWRCSATATPRTPTAPPRCAGSRGGSSAPPRQALPGAVADHPGGRGRRPAPSPRRARRRAPLRADDLARRALRRRRTT